MAKRRTYSAEFGHDLLAQVARLAGGRDLATVASGHAGPLAVLCPDRLDTCLGGWRQHPLPPGGAETGRNPTDRGKLGCKHHLAVDARGLPLAVILSGANRHDSRCFIPVLEAIPPVRGLPGHPRRRPEKVHADKGYDFPYLRQYLQRLGIRPRIARRGIESRERLGRYRWVVERTFSWLHRMRRLRIRYERRTDIHQAFLQLGCALIAWRHVQRFC